MINIVKISSQNFMQYMTLDKFIVSYSEYQLLHTVMVLLIRLMFYHLINSLVLLRTQNIHVSNFRTKKEHCMYIRFYT